MVLDAVAPRISEENRARAVESDRKGNGVWDFGTRQPRCRRHINRGQGLHTC